MRLSTKLALAMGLILLFAFQATGAYVLQNVKNHYVDHFSRALAAQGELLAFYLAPYVAKAETEREDIVLADIDNVLRNMTSLSGIRVQVLSSDGVVLAASPPDPAAVGLRNTEPEAQSALSGIPASKRGVRADSGRVEVLAVPIEHDRETVGAVYLIASMEAMYATIAGIMRIYVTGALIALLLTVAVTVLVTRAIVRPLKDLTKQAEAMMGGDFTVRVTVFDDDEIGHLGRAFNTLAGRLRQAMASYEAEQEKLRSILTHMSEGVLATDETGRIVAINPKALTLLGLPGDEAAWIDRPAVGAFGLPEEEEFTDFLSRTGSFFIEVPPGRTLRVTTSPVAHGEKNLGVIAVLSDVTEEKRVEMNQKAFVANVSHELKTPLSTMKSYLEALLEESPETPVARRFLSTVAQETERMIRLVGDLLFLTRLDAEAMPLRLERHDLGGVVRSAAERFARPFAQKGVSLAVDAPEDHFFADIDRDKIDRVLDNVLSNALKFTPEGGRTALTIRAADDGETVEIAVCDTGIGIPESERTRVFERFYRVDKGRSRSLGGSGLGLSIAREIVVRHGGAIEAQGNADGGTTIAIRLPHPQAKGRG
ncbi:MAG: HAMP domain-containing protein [Hydrogenibacillus sp.]|nr:HAMP domain-containing protein [Hydrogenibacillus sp.]